MKATLVPAHAVPLSRQVHVFNEAFRGYIGGFAPMELPGFARLLASQGVDLALSRFVILGRSEAGFAYVNRTGGVLRVAGMGVISAARGKGAGKRLLGEVLAEARLRGDRLATLEVFEDNTPARELYQAHGFRKVDRLAGWTRAAEAPLPPASPLPPAGAASAPAQGGRAAPREIDLLEALQLPAARDYPVVPWQASRFGLTQAAAGTRAWAHEGSRWIISDPSAPKVVIRSLLPGPEQDAGPALQTAGMTLLRHFPGRHWHAPAYLPEDLGRAALASLGFGQEPLAQWLMHCPLA